MSSPYTFQVLLHILTNEQELLKRTDQKASALMSTLGIFMVFFIVHYRNIPPTIPVLILIYLYFAAAFVTISSLLFVMNPRIKNPEIQNAQAKKLPNPTFFAGIAQYETQAKYQQELDSVLKNEEVTYEIFASNIFAIGHINAMKFKYFNRGMRAFAVAIFFELVVIISMYANTSLSEMIVRP
jgi:hypothetical protein